MTFEKINGNEEKITKFGYHFFCEEDWEEKEENRFFFNYDYDTIEGIDHIISELDLENKTDNNFSNFLYRLKGRKYYFYSQTEEYKNEREERRKKYEHIKFLNNSFSLADVIENVEKEIMKLEEEFDEYLELDRLCRLDIHGCTQEQNFISWLARLMSWHRNKGHELPLYELWEDSSGLCSETFDILHEDFTQKSKTQIREFKNRFNRLFVDELKESILSEFYFDDRGLKMIKAFKEAQLIVDKCNEAIKDQKCRFELFRAYFRKLPEVEVRENFDETLDTEKETNKKINEWLRKSKDVKLLEEILARAGFKKIESVKKRFSPIENVNDLPAGIKTINMNRSIYRICLCFAKAIENFALNEARKCRENQISWNNYQEYHQFEFKQNNTYEQLWEQAGLKSYYNYQHEKKLKKKFERLLKKNQPTKKKPEWINTTYYPNPPKSQTKPWKKSPPPLPKPQLPPNNIPPLKNLFQQAQFKIKTLLTKYAVKVKDLPSEYHDWNRKIEQMTSLKEIIDFVEKMEQTITQTAQQQATITPTNNFTTPWKLVIGLGVILLLVEIVYVYYLWVKKGILTE
jgi:hypothetical protein